MANVLALLESSFSDSKEQGSAVPPPPKKSISLHSVTCLIEGLCALISGVVVNYNVHTYASKVLIDQF